jgi:hypothetical protein
MRKTMAIAGMMVVAASPSLADSPSTAITASGYAPQVCTVSAWSKISGSGTLTGGVQSVLTYDESDLVDASSMSVLDASKAFTLRIPVLCNTSVTWGILGAKGALRHNSDPVTPSGFAKQWLYRLTTSAKTASGGTIGATVTYDSSGTPLSGMTSTFDQSLSQTLAYFTLTFTPLAVSQRMLAGSYSEVLTITIQPGM